MKTRNVQLVLAYLMLLTSLATFVSALSPSDTLTVRVVAPATAFPGETVTVFVEVTFNGTLRNGTIRDVSVWFIDGGQLRNQTLPVYTRFATGRYYTNYTIPDNATGVYWFEVRGSYRGFNATGAAGVTVVNPNTGAQGLNNQVGDLTKAVNSLNDQVKLLNNMVWTLTYAVYVAVAASVMMGILAVVISLRKRFS